ncbi:MAG: hypothetical protein H6668_04680 [Ardenticatenaceae bacterium]|nr:hypothetical protein [Ardenticatenaceae bacterium]
MSEKEGDNLFQTESYERAIKKYRAELKKLGKKPEDKLRKARLHRKIGNCYRRKGQYIPSLDEYDDGLNVIVDARATKNIKIERACLLYEKGVCYFYADPVDLAKYFAESSQKLLVPFAKVFDSNIQSGLGNVYQFLAILERTQGDYSQFFKNMDQAKRHFDLADDEKRSLEYEMNLNTEHLYSGNFQKPINFFNGALTKIQQLVPERISFAYLNLAFAYADAGQLSLAEVHANNSLSAAQKSQDPIGQQRAYEVLAKIALGRARQAINANENNKVQEYIGEIRELVNKGNKVAHNLQGGEYKEFEYIGKLINVEASIIAGDLNRADDLLVGALSFRDVNNLNLSLDSRAEAHRIRSLLDTAYAERSNIATEKVRYWKDALRELNRARSILEKDHLCGKLVLVGIETAKLEILLDSNESALKTLDSALDTAQQYDRDNDVESTLETMKPLLDKKKKDDETKDDVKRNRLLIQYKVPFFHSFCIELFNLLVEKFNLDELRTLCFTLKIDHEEFPLTHSGMARELILWTTRRERLCELNCCARQKRPNIDWPTMPNCDCKNIVSDCLQQKP